MPNTRPLFWSRWRNCLFACLLYIIESFTHQKTLINSFWWYGYIYLTIKTRQWKKSKANMCCKWVFYFRFSKETYFDALYSPNDKIKKWIDKKLNQRVLQKYTELKTRTIKLDQNSEVVGNDTLHYKKIISCWFDTWHPLPSRRDPVWKIGSQYPLLVVRHN